MSSVVGVLLRKELLDVSRDRRTLAMTLLLPVLLYPAMMMTVSAAVAAGKARLALEKLDVGVCSDDAQQFLESRPTPAHTRYRRMERAQAEEALKAKELAAIVDAPAGSFGAVGEKGQAVVTLLYTKRHDRSVEGRDRVRAVLDEVSKSALRVRLSEAQLPETFAEPVRREERDLDFQNDWGPFLASRLFPTLILMMLFLGAIYPAVDLTAGEKERGTLETLLVAPVRPLQVMYAKFVAVALAAVVAALANLVAMVATFASGLGFGPVDVSVTLRPGQVLTLAVCLVPAAIFAAGVSLAIASLARSFKEGQTMMTPLLVVAMVPGMMAMMPGVELNGWTAWVPLLNVALLIKATALDAANPLHAAVTVAITLGCALLGLRLAANAFQSESLRFGARGTFSDLWRRERVGLPSRSEGKGVKS